MRRSIAVGVAATSATLVALITPGQATADTSATTTGTFVIANGALAITAPGTASLEVNPTGTTASGTISAITVTDERRGTTGWKASVTVSRFVGPGGTLNFGPFQGPYVPGTAAVTGTARVTPSTPSALLGVVGIGTAQVVQTATGVVGANTATWTPTLTVPIPTNLAAGTYSSPVTHSVI